MRRVSRLIYAGWLPQDGAFGWSWMHVSIDERDAGLAGSGLLIVRAWVVLHALPRH